MRDAGMDADHAMAAGILIDGTFNPNSNHFYCDSCYVKVGEPMQIAP